MSSTQKLLDTEDLNSDQMYDAVKRHEAYVARSKRLQGRSADTRVPASASTGYKPRYQKATAFSAMAAETLEPEVNSAGTGEGLEEGLVEIDPSPEDSRGVYIPDFLAEAPVGGNWVLTGRVARAIQADEKLKQRCLPVKALIILLGTAHKQKMEEGPNSRGGLKKTIRPQ